MPSVVDLPDMLPEQKMTFESMAVSSTFDDEGIGQQDSLWTVCSLTPRVFEKDAECKVLQKAEQDVRKGNDSGVDVKKSSDNLPVKLKPKES